MEGETYNLSRYNYELPESFIAQTPLVPRDSSRLLVIHREGRLEDRRFTDILDYLRPGDLLVLNDTRVINARIYAKRHSGGALEIFLLHERALGVWEALVNPARRARVGDTITLDRDFTAKIVDKTADGGRVLEFSPKDIKEKLCELGEVPLPRYIKQMTDDPNKYQTVYAQNEGAVAAPTAGLHFTPTLLEKVKAKGIEIVYLTLHCGLATFRPVKNEDVRTHPMASEWVELSKAAAEKINKAKHDKRRVIAVGTTSLRSLESAAHEGGVREFRGKTDIYIYPGYEFKVIDGLITNFHTPCSTNLILISTFAGYDLVRKAYQHAIDEKYRFFSFGDATLII